MDFCKSRTEKSSPDMFNCCAILVAHDMITDAGSVTTCRRKLKAQSLQTKSTKMEGLPKIISRKNRLMISDKIKYTF